MRVQCILDNIDNWGLLTSSFIDIFVHLSRIDSYHHIEICLCYRGSGYDAGLKGLLVQTQGRACSHSYALSTAHGICLIG